MIASDGAILYDRPMRNIILLIALLLSACESASVVDRADSSLDAPEVADVLPADAPDATMDGGPQDAGAVDAD